MDDHGDPRLVRRTATRRDVPRDLPRGVPSRTPVPPSPVRPYAELPAHAGESAASADPASADPAPGTAVPPSGEAYGQPAAERRGGGAERTLVRRPTGRAARGFRAVRAVAVTGGAVTAVLLLMTLVLHQTGAWPFARDDGAAGRSVPDARLPLPPSAAGSGGSPSGIDDGDETDRGRNGEDGARGGGDEGRPGQRPGRKPSPPGAGMPAPGGGGATEDCGCRASWQADGQRAGQGQEFNATVRVVNVESGPVRAWRVTWAWPSGQRLVEGWNARFRESGGTVSVRSASESPRIPVGGEATFGLRISGGSGAAPRLVCQAL